MPQPNLKILLDEPLQGLAPALATEYSNALKQLQQRPPDLCMVVTDSNGSLLKDVPDHVLHIERGELSPAVNACRENDLDPMSHLPPIEAQS